MFYSDEASNEILNLSMAILEMSHFKMDKEENILDVYYRNPGLKYTDEDKFIKIEDVKVEKDKDGKYVIALIADTDYEYEVTPIKVHKRKIYNYGQKRS